MSSKRLFRVLLRPYTTEKSMRVAEKNQIVFEVLPDATKTEISGAVEKIFNVKVKSVRTARMQGKEKRFKGYEGRRSDWKKAYVCLEEGHDINLSDYQ